MDETVLNMGRNHLKDGQNCLKYWINCSEYMTNAPNGSVFFPGHASASCGCPSGTLRAAAGLSSQRTEGPLPAKARRPSDGPVQKSDPFWGCRNKAETFIPLQPQERASPFRRSRRKERESISAKPKQRTRVHPAGPIQTARVHSGAAKAKSGRLFRFGWSNAETTQAVLCKQTIGSGR